MLVGGRKIQKERQMQAGFGAFVLPYPRGQRYFAVGKYGTVGIRQYPQPPGTTGPHTWGHKKMRRLQQALSPLTCPCQSVPFPGRPVSNTSYPVWVDRYKDTSSEHSYQITLLLRSPSPADSMGNTSRWLLEPRFLPSGWCSFRPCHLALPGQESRWRLGYV